MDLETVGEWKAGTGAPIRLGAHNRRHPHTGALFALAYSVDRAGRAVPSHGNLVRTSSPSSPRRP